LTAREIVDEGQRQGLFDDSLSGKTPQQTMKSKLSVNIRRLGSESQFARTEPGKFTLRSAAIAQNVDLHEAQPQKKSLAEDVLVFDVSEFPKPRFQGVRHEWRQFLNRLHETHAFRYLPRFTAEQNEDYKQVLTYVLVTKGGRVLAYDRGSYSTADSFLRGRSCIGFGGHTSMHDVQGLSLFAQRDFGVIECAARELAEELNLPKADRDRLNERKIKIIGVLNDDSSENGRRHLAFVLRYEVSSAANWANPAKGEQSITNLRWLAPGELIDLTRFEYWSQLCLREFFPQLHAAQSRYRIMRKAPLRPPHIMAICGPIAAGKTIASELLVQAFGYTSINTGVVLANELGIAPVDEASRLAFQEEAHRYIAAPGGPARFAAAISAEISSRESPRVVLDGVRQPETIRELRARLRQRVGILHVETPIDLAYSFYRQRYGSDISFEEYMRVRSSPVEHDIPELSRMADAVIYNRAGKNEYQVALRDLMTAVGVRLADGA
jgi:predicted NUDIX family phosphoesterase/dephospho-CoA kinase